MGHKDLGIRNYNPSLAAQKTKGGKSYLDRIRKMEPYERLLYWIKERQAIHCNRFTSAADFADYCSADANPENTEVQFDYQTAPPWTDDPIFQTVFFCNVYRENDKVTSFLRECYREPYAEYDHVFLGSILLRWYNYIPTMQALINAKIPQSFAPKRHPGKWDAKGYMKLLCDIRYNDGAKKEGQLFGGAYIIRPIVDGKTGARKIESIGELLTNMARDKYLYPQVCGNRSHNQNGRNNSTALLLSPRKFASLGSSTDNCEPGTMSYAFARLMRFSGMGKFYNYQFIGDLAYTHVLRDAPDWFTWSFCGPGTSRGLLRLTCPSGKATLRSGKRLPRLMPLQRGWQEQLLELQKQVNRDLGVVARHPSTKQFNAQLANLKKGGEVRELRPLHMRDLTNCLCEYDKYERALFNERSIKRPYRGTGA